ncbi:hypothetical protein RND81_03G156300 [Saponaria officinalis]|uniref:Uncharacterized protein n=1 Tax=Saponaria officinalis TaxID=3572 RepID=A0AAW1M8D2_SAPOF
MTFSVKYLCLFVALVCLIRQGRSECTKDDIKIGQKPTGQSFNGVQEWQVTVTNGCPTCRFMQIELSVYGFQSIEPVDPAQFDFKGIYGSVNNGQPIDPHATFAFTYAWNSPFTFYLQDATSACW